MATKLKLSKPAKGQVLQLEADLSTKDFGTSDAFADNTGWTNLLGGPYGQSHTGIFVNPINSLQASTVYSCVSILVGDLAKLPLRMMRETTDGLWVEDRKHPVARLLRRPNRRMTQHDFTSHIVMSLLLVGNAYVAVIRNEDGVPIELVPLIPNTVSIREDSNGNLFYMATSRLFPGEFGHVRTLSEEDMIHVRNISFDGGIRGASVTQLASEVLGLALATQQHAGAMFKNGAHFLGLLKTEQRLSKETIEQTSETWNRRDAGGVSGIGNSYRTPILQGGLEFQSVGMDAQQSQLIETRKLLVEEVARLFKIPLYKLSSVDKMGYNSIDAQSQDYIDSTLIPLANPIEQALARTLLFEREFDGYRFSFDFDLLERGDIKTRTDYQHQMMSDGVFSVNEVRKMMNLPSIGPEGDIRTKPINTGVVGDPNALPNYQIDAPLKTEETAPASKLNGSGNVH